LGGYYRMLLLQRHTNESVVIHNKDDPSNCVVVRVCDVYPTGDVTLGFIGDNYTVIRNEIFNQRTTLEESKNEENLTDIKEMYYERRNNGYYG
jgi:sRNA-binding carbon storage regulator CsrA